MRSRLPALAVVLILLVSACSKKPLPISSFPESSLEKARLNSEDLDFTYLSARSRVRYEDQATNFSATANIRVLKDSLIWFSMSNTIGIEGVRGLISRDSIQVMDRIKKTYSVYNFEGLGAEFNFPIDFDLVQALLLGKMTQPISDDDLIRKEKGFLVIEQSNSGVSVMNYVDRKTSILKKMEFAQNPSPNQMSLEFDNFKPVETIVFPFASQVKVDYTDEGNILNTVIGINYTKVTFDEKPLRFPFSIPSKYEPK